MRRRLRPIASPRLARLISIGKGDFVGWDEADLAAILQMQLRAPLLGTLKPTASEIQKIMEREHLPGSALPQTVRELLVHPHPPLSLLRRAKDFAKTADSGKDPLPPLVATALYLSAIAAAFVRHSKRVTTMNDTELRGSLQWITEQAWIDPSLRTLSGDAVAKLADDAGQNGTADRCAEYE